MEELVDFDTFRDELERFGQNFGRNTCYDYVDSAFKRGDKVGVTLFIEPCGTLTKMGNSLKEVVDWWITVLEVQPDVSYVCCGWYLYDNWDKVSNLQAVDVWKDMKMPEKKPTKEIHRKDKE